MFNSRREAGRSSHAPNRSTRRRNWSAQILVACGIAAAVAACGSSSSSSPSASSSPTATSANAAATTTAAPGTGSAAQTAVAAHTGTTSTFHPPGPPVDAKSLKGKSLWFVPIATVIPAVPPEAGGVQQAAKALGMSYHVCNGNFVPATESACIQQAVNAGAAGIITDAIDPTTVSTATAYAAAHHVPTVAMSETGTNSKWVQIAQPTYYPQIMSLAADWIVAGSHGKANVLSATVSGDAGTDSAATDFANELKKQCPTCTLDNVTESPSASNAYTSAVSSALLQHSTINYVFPEFDAVVEPVARGAQESGHKVTMISTTGALPDLKQIKAGGPQVADAAANPNYLGWAAVDTLVRMMLGKPAPTNTLVPVRLFDTSNIASVDLTQAASLAGSWWGPTTYHQEFAKLWGVG